MALGSLIFPKVVRNFKLQGCINARRACFSETLSRNPLQHVYMSARTISTEAEHVGKACTKGTNPEHARYAHKWCENLEGAWKEVKIDEIILQELSGGLSSDVYKCSLPAETKTKEGEPRDVLLRIYGKTGPIQNPLLKVAFEKLSEEKLGPKLHGMYEEGRIEEFIPSSRSLKTSELSIHWSKIAKAIARLHTLKIESITSATPTFLEGPIVADWLHEAVIESNRDVVVMQDGSPIDLLKEFEDIKEIQSKFDSDIVFCHNDLQEGNILLTDEEDRLVFIDLDFYGKNYRGFDIGNHFAEWAIDNDVKEKPFFSYDPDRFPSKDTREQFIREYLTELRRLEGNSSPIANTEVSDLNRKACYFAVISHFVWAIWAIAQKSNKTFDYREYARRRLAAYLKYKDSLRR